MQLKRLIISDANVLIDMEVGQLLIDMFQLPERFGVPDILFVEELEENHPELPEYGLEVLVLREEAVKDVYELGQRYQRPSQMDLFALALARQENCPLLTGDKHLREAAERESVDVCGTLWLIERMTDEKFISIDEARQAYDKMKRADRRLPWQQVGHQLARLTKK